MVIRLGCIKVMQVLYKGFIVFIGIYKGVVYG